MVVKKNAPVLRRLKRALGKLSEIERRSIPTLVIDDECDHASVNTAALRSDVSRINGLIRDICQKLPKVSYVGYTATPYANVLMAETSVDGSRDLYPSEFIVSLPEPENYFGARRLFGDDQGADRNDELPYIRRVPDEDMSSLQPQSRKNRDQFSPELTTSLRSACDYFLLALAARAHRGQASCHCCMLVHTTIYSVCHRRLRSLIKDTWLNPILRDLHAGNPERLDQLRSLWERESTALAHELREQLSCPNELESFELILPYLLSAAGSITITVENSDVQLAERLDFSSQTPIHTIVIGGNVLARGLTIEGLVISFFIRSSSQYDTLMQMGRWFGYRRGYEDLPRIWMTRELEYFFRDLVNVEELIRNEIVEITRRGWTPADMAVRVPQIASLSITARNKLVMENLEQCDLSFYGCHEQTIGFPVDDEFHRNNWEAGKRLLMEAMANNGGGTETVGSSTLIRQVRAGPVRRFLHRYKAEAITIQKVAEFVDNELDAAETCMESWNLALVSAGDSHVISYGGVEKTGLLNRNKINPAYKIPSPHPDSITQELSSRIYLKALMGVSDMLVDVDRQQYKQWLKGLKDPGFSTEKNSWESVKRYRMEVLGQRPLLLLYPINRNSRPKRYNPSEPMDDFSRLPLLHGLPEGALTHHILGIGIVFPEVTRATAKHFLRVRLERPLEGEAFDDDEILRLQSAAEEEL
ncbi:MAG: hypothetical protein ERJ68_00455 [Aphanocapsa feldmannii 277cI]|uniref:Putative endonuclease Z1 domain-containing protein n=1 Tax=Aphanocapsa feldmannii 277cI TaxID=2507554 RepID=A0A524RVT2_9CHRO|nr:MAG: hypothetical protein ERJ68_00455 [Aphanocapsa feldmannii 277cI]